jgi:hypothetical protein
MTFTSKNWKRNHFPVCGPPNAEGIRKWSAFLLFFILIFLVGRESGRKGRYLLGTNGDYTMICEAKLCFKGIPSFSLSRVSGSPPQGQFIKFSSSQGY